MGEQDRVSHILTKPIPLIPFPSSGNFSKLLYLSPQASVSFSQDVAADMSTSNACNLTVGIMLSSVVRFLLTNVKIG